MRTIIDIAVDAICAKCSKGEEVEFMEIFNDVENILGGHWKSIAEQKNVDYSQIKENKIGELYKIMTLDARFVRKENGSWTKRPGFEK